MQFPAPGSTDLGAQQRLGFWSVNLRTGAVTWDGTTALIHAKRPGYAPTLQEALGFFAVSDRARVVHEALAAYDARRLFDIEAQLDVEDGIHVRLIGGRGYDTRDDCSVLHGIIETLEQPVRAICDEASDKTFCVATLLHELQGRVSSIAVLAAQASGGTDGDLAQSCLARIEQDAAGLQRIIDAVMHLRRGDRPRLEQIDASAMARSVWEFHAMHNRAWAHAIVTIEPGMKLIGDPFELELVFENLVGNALKFSATREQPQVRITTTRERDRTVVHVNDNGVGFAPAHAAEIFNLFTRRSEPKVDGTGVGLAIARRVVERHGGLIWANGAPGHGATFSFFV
jgi:signal transduction histidine kinase